MVSSASSANDASTTWLHFLFVRVVLTEWLAELERDNTVPEVGFRVEVHAMDVALDNRMLYGFVILEYWTQHYIGLASWDVAVQYLSHK